VEVQSWQNRVDEINALSCSLAEETQDLAPSVQRSVEVSDTESEQGFRLGQLGLATGTNKLGHNTPENPGDEADSKTPQVNNSEESSQTQGKPTEDDKDERPQSRVSVQSDDTDVLMHECDESVKGSSSESASDEDVQSEEALELMSSLDEAMNTDQVAMSFDSLASSTSTVTIEGQYGAQWSGVPVITSTGSLESTRVFEWQPSESTKHKVKKQSQLVSNTEEQALEQADSLSDISTIYSDCSMKAEGTDTPLKQYEYLEKLDTPRTPRTEEGSPPDDSQSQVEPRTLSVMSPVSGDQVI
jgi:hypothetical protein